jgi:hypothetical protein
VTYINSDVLPELTWASRMGASSPRAISFPGATVPAAGCGTGPSTAIAGPHAAPRVRGQVTFVAPPQLQDAVATLLGQTNIHNYMTGVTAVGEGASGPPREREPV